MGCQCCRMIKSYIYDPSVVDGRKSDSAGSSLYHQQRLSGGGPGGDPNKQKHGIHNLGYSKSSDSTLKMEADNNQVNQRLHAAPSSAKDRQGSAPPPEVYIIQPDPSWPSQVPIYPNIREYEKQRSYGEPGQRRSRSGWDSGITIDSEIMSADEIDEGVGGTPEYPCDTGDEGSVLSVDIHTSTTSLSSADTRDERRLPKTPDVSTGESGISVMKSEDEEEAVDSITDSMVAEALAALEAATAGEECE